MQRVLTIGPDIIEEVATTFDMLPSGDRGLQAGEEKELPAKIFSESRAEIWASGNGTGDTHNL